MAETVKFFDATVDGWPRIAEVRSTTQEGLDEAYEEYYGEIDWQDLPNNFIDWKRYSVHADLSGNSTVLWSLTGE